MTNKNDNKGNIFEGIGGLLKKGFDAAGKTASQGAKNSDNAIKEAVDLGEKVIDGAKDGVEGVIGKGRITGAVIGVKVGGTIGLMAGVPGMIKGAVIGGAIGFVGGQTVVDLYERDKKKEESNDNKPEADKKPDATPPVPASRPDDPAP